MDKLTGLFRYFITASCLSLLLASCATSGPKTVVAEEKIITEPAPAVEVTAENTEEFNVSEDVYTKTFTDIDKLIAELNKIIRDENFTEWKKYLTDEYITYYSDPDNLKVLSNTPTLKKYNIVIRSLKDYFIYVVVPSRSNVNLDDISFIDDNNIKAYMKIDGDPVVLYNLKYIDETWKIGL